MIPPRLQWCHQICVTSVCWPKAASGQPSACSNCTRLLGHESKRYVMTPEQFELCLRVARDFVFDSPPCPKGRQNKVIGIFGGEPLMSPHFPTYVDIACDLLPARHRGLWTSFDWPNYRNPKWGDAAPLVRRLLGRRNGRPIGYLNWNMHEVGNVCEHHPVLVSISDVVQDERRRWELISECWLNRDWSAAYALDHAGEAKFYFCEIASSFDRVMRLGTGLPVLSGVWNGDLSFVPDDHGVLRPVGPYAAQILASCSRCGQALPVKRGRRDLDNVDDISPSNLTTLRELGSPMVARGDYADFDPALYEEPDQADYAGTYIKSGTVRSSKIKHRRRWGRR